MDGVSSEGGEIVGVMDGDDAMLCAGDEKLAGGIYLSALNACGRVYWC